MSDHHRDQVFHVVSRNRRKDCGGELSGEGSRPVKERIGLLAGSGRLPFYALRGIVAAGCQTVVIGLAEEVDAELAALEPSLVTLPVGSLGRMAEHLRREGVTRLVLAGKVHKTPVFSGEQIDQDIAALLARLSRKNDDAILGSVCEYFASAGLTVLPQTEFLQELLVGKGVLSRRWPDEQERADIAFGFEMAKSIGALDFGQSVVVKGQAVLAVEAVEGTDETIRRGGHLGHGGVTLVKVSKPQQDPRFDVPTVGPNTMANLKEAGASVMAIEAGKTFFIDRQACLSRANEADMAVVAVDSYGLY